MIRKVLALGHHLHRRRFRRPLLRRHPGQEPDVPDAAVSIAIRVRVDGNDRGVANANLDENVREEQPVLIVSHLRIGKFADIVSLGGQLLAHQTLEQPARGHAIWQDQLAVRAAH